MRRYCILSYINGLCLLLITLIVIATVSKCELNNDSEGQGGIFTSKNFSNFARIVRGSDSTNNRQELPRGRLAGVGNLTDQFSLQYQAVYGSLSSPSTSRTPTTATLLKWSQQQCLSTSASFQSNVTTVSLLRISSQLFQMKSLLAPITFSVDSTIFRIAIKVNGSNAMETTIVDPTGKAINSRLKRSADTLQRDQYHERWYSRPMSKFSKLSHRETIRLSRKRPIILQKQHRRLQHEHQSKDNKRTFPKLLPHQNGEDVQRQKTQQQEINDSLSLQHPFVKHKMKTWIDDRQHQHSRNSGQQNGRQYYSQHRNISPRHLMDKQQTQLHFPKKDHTQQSILTNEVFEKILYLSHNSLSVVDTHRSVYRHKPTVQNSGLRYGEDELPHPHSKWKLKITKPSHPQHSLHQLSYFNQSNRSKQSRDKESTQSDRSKQSRDLESTQSDRGKQSGDLKSIKSLQTQKKFISRRHQTSRRHPTSRRQPTNSSRHPTTSSRHLTTEGEYLRINTTPTRHRSNRRRRSGTLMSLVESDGAAVWEVEPPQIGLWTISVNGNEPVQILVTGLSSLDFKFEFLDVRNMTAMTTQPVAYDATLTRLTLVGVHCVNNITILHLYNDAGETISVIQSTDFEMDHVTADGRTATFLMVLNMPDVPFYMSVTGYDVMGAPFQRMSSVRVVPRMFALSFVHHRTDDLVPGTNYNFEVRLRNKGHSDTFNVTGTWDNPDYFSVTILPEMIQVAQDQISHVTLVIKIRPSINFITERMLTITATRLSDNVTDTLTDTITAEPISFLHDHQAPVCSVLYLSGVCRKDVACEDQMWAASVDVTDSVTGVRSAMFLNPIPGVFNRVQFSYSLTNRTAQAYYRSTCCNIQATLLAYDYVGNRAYCRLTPTLIDLTTSSMYSRLPTALNGNITQYSAEVSLSTLSTLYKNYPENASTTTFSATEAGLSPVGPQFKQTTVLNCCHASSIQSGTGIDATKTSLSEYVSERSTRRANSNVTRSFKTEKQQQQGNVVNASSLRLAAIICGSIAGTAGMTIAVICVIYRCTYMTRLERERRRRSNGSDVTMGSSSESRSEGSSDAGSLRMTTMGKKAEKRIIRHNIYTSQENRRGIGHSKEEKKASTRQSSFIPTIDQILKNGSNNPGEAVQKIVDKGSGRLTSSRREEVADIIFKCVIVHVGEEENSKSKIHNTHDSLEENSSKSKIHTTHDSLEENSKISYSPILRASGKTYASMIQVQQQIEEMDKQRMRLASAVSERARNSKPNSNTFQRIHNRHGNMQTNIESMNGSVDVLKAKSVSHEYVPPGSPRLQQSYTSALDTIGENSQGNICTSEGSERFRSIRTVPAVSTISSGESKDTTGQVDAEVNKTKSAGDVPTYINLQYLWHNRLNDIQNDKNDHCISYSTNVYHASRNTNGRIISQKRHGKSTSRQFRTHSRSQRVNYQSTSQNTSNQSTFQNVSVQGTPQARNGNIYFQNTHYNNSSCNQAFVPEENYMFATTDTAMSSYNKNVSMGTNDTSTFSVIYSGDGKKITSPSYVKEYVQDTEDATGHLPKTSFGNSRPFYFKAQSLSSKQFPANKSATKRQEHTPQQQQQQQQQQLIHDLSQITSTKTDQPTASIFKQCEIESSAHVCSQRDEIVDSNQTIRQSVEKSVNLSYNMRGDKVWNSETGCLINLPYSDSPTHLRSDSSESGRYTQQAISDEITSNASQIAFRQDLHHIREKLLNFQRRIDQEIDQDDRKSRDHSPSSSHHSNFQDA